MDYLFYGERILPGLFCFQLIARLAAVNVLSDLGGKTACAYADKPAISGWKTTAG